MNLNNTKHELLEEVFALTGVSSCARLILDKVLDRPGLQFCELAYHFDRLIQQEGFSEAVRSTALYFFSDLQLHGSETLPPDGPLLIVANHPGVMDFLALNAGIPRDDVKIVTRKNALFRQLPLVRAHLIYSQRDLYVNSVAFWQCVRHLRKGGTLLLYGSGQLDPDPASMPGAEQALGDWSPSLPQFFKRVPGLRLQTAIISGVISPGSLAHPLVQLSPAPCRQHMLAEVLQLAQQMVYPQPFSQHPTVMFDVPITKDDLPTLLPSDTLQFIISRARQVMAATQPVPVPPADEHSFFAQESVLTDRW